MAIFKRPALKTQSRKKREMPQGLWQKCPGCSEVVHEIELAQNQRVCPRCDYHFAQSAKERIENLLDPTALSSATPICARSIRFSFKAWLLTRIGS